MESGDISRSHLTGALCRREFSHGFAFAATICPDVGSPLPHNYAAG